MESITPPPLAQVDTARTTETCPDCRRRVSGQHTAWECSFVQRLDRRRTEMSSRGLS